MAISFDGPNKTITLSSGDTQVDVAEIYSAWKDWVMVGNAQFAAAFRVVGGDPLGGGAYAATNVFLQNDVGWRIKPPEEEIQIEIVGNLYAEAPATAWLAPTTGSYDTSVTRTLSANLLQVATASPAVEDVALILKLLRNKTVTDPSSGVMTVYDDDGIATLFTADIFEDAAGTAPYDGQGVNRRDRLA